MKRLVTGVVAGLIWVLMCFFSHTIAWPIAATFLCVVAVYEILRCVGVKNEMPLVLPSLLFALMPLCTWLLCPNGEDIYRIFYLFGGIYFLLLLVIANVEHNRIHSEKLFAVIAFVFYVTYSFTALTMLRVIPEGIYFFLLAFLGAWISDTFALVFGLTLGKHKLCPNISPKKTVEGSIGGVLANILFFLAYAYVLSRFFNMKVQYLGFAILGAVLSVIGQLGDLFASCIKRHYHIKDYGNLFPGHGGSLDRFDSVLTIADVMYLCFALFGTSGVRFLLS